MTSGTFIAISIRFLEDRGDTYICQIGGYFSGPRSDYEVYR